MPWDPLIRKIAVLHKAPSKPARSTVFVTPLVVDLDRNGGPSLLAGSKWKWGRKPSSKDSVYRLIDLDGTGAKEWEWVGPDDGLLVWLKDLQGTPTGKDLFGSRTWFKPWNNGFEPLSVLDENKDKVLTGEELKFIGVWQDANGDAIAQEGEITTAADRGITSIGVTYRGRHSRAVGKKGVMCNGKRLRIWDWWSAGRPATSDVLMD